jgi:hypothetical protein
MWFLALPDILVFLSIFWGGVLTGVIAVFIILLVYCSGGGIIRIQYTSNKDNIKQEDF